MSSRSIFARFFLVMTLFSFAGRASLAMAASDEPPCAIRMVDATDASGIDFRHHHGGAGKGYIVEGMAGGLALFDYDGDGMIDVYFLNGAPLKGTEVDRPLHNALYRNNGDWTFSDVTEEAGVGDPGHGMGVAAADYDNDGDVDLFVNNFGPNVLYRNNGDRTFTNVADEVGVRGGNRVGAGVAFCDIEGDGDLDLFVANYVDFTYENHVPIVIQGQRFQAGPQYYRPVPDSLFRNDGDGTFNDISRESGIAAVAGPGMGVVCGDFDEDGDPDIFVCNDGEANFLFQNDGTGKFREAGLVAGVAYDFQGRKNSSMGVACGDYDNDGHLDLFVTDYQAEMPVMYRYLGGGLFEDATSTARISDDLFPHVHWGAGLVDFDNDGDRDLFIACGHFDRIEQLDDRTSLELPNFLLMNTGDGRFTDVSNRCGDGLNVVASSRGAAFDDLDNDGDIDAVILNSHTRPTILRNDSTGGGHWLEVELRGTTSNASGVGARVRVVSDGRSQVAEVHSGRGYQSHYGTRLHFGLADQPHVDRIEVRWPTGKLEAFPATAADQRVELIEGSGDIFVEAPP